MFKPVTENIEKLEEEPNFSFFGENKIVSSKNLSSKSPSQTHFKSASKIQKIAEVNVKFTSMLELIYL